MLDTVPEAVGPQVDVQGFREIMAHWASGVTIVTTRQALAPVGMTVSAFTSLSLQPPQILICANRRSQTHAAIVKSGYFAVNLLSVEQLEWGMRFADQPSVTDRFAGMGWSTAQTGAPILFGGLGWLDCTLHQAITGDDHTILIGNVVAGSAAHDLSDDAPLLYYRRHWRRLAAQAVQ